MRIKLALAALCGVHRHETNSVGFSSVKHTPHHACLTTSCLLSLADNGGRGGKQQSKACAKAMRAIFAKLYRQSY